jgi:hypothetical protein
VAKAARPSAGAPRYDDALTLREARALYFRENGFGEDGGYAERWVRVKLGPVPLAFPNTQARVRAVRYHDLHHVVTGYATDVVGEAEIGAWEIASGCAGFAAAWILNLYALVLGLAADAGATWRAFLRGRCTRNLYRADYGDALLAERVGAVRARLGLDAVPAAAPGPPTAADRAAFAAWAAASLALAVATLAIPVAPLAWALRALA